MNFSFRQYGFLLSVVLLHAVYFMAACYYGNICNGDSFEYVYEATNILDSGFFYSGNPVLPLQEEYMTLRTPVYPLFLAGVYFFSVNNLLVLLLQNCVSIVNVMLTRKTAMFLGYTPKLDIWFFLLLLIFPSQFVYANVLSPDILLQTCSILYFRYGLLYLKERSEGSYGFKMSLALIVGMFVKPVMYPFVIVHLSLILVVALVDKRVDRKILTQALLPLLCVIVYSQVNKVRTGKFHFSSIQSVNALYNHLCYYYEKVGFDKGELFMANEKRKLEQLPTFKSRYEYATRRGMELLKENFTSYVPFHLKKTATFFLQTGKGELDQFTGHLTLAKVYAGKSLPIGVLIREKNIGGLVQYAEANPSFMLGVATFFSNLLKLLGIYLFVQLSKTEALVKWFVGLYLLYFALITGPVPNAHYTMPVSLLIMCCALTGYLYKFNKASVGKT